MRSRTIALTAGVGMAATAALARAGRLRAIPANIRRYSMPSAGVYDAVARPLMGSRYAEIAEATAREAPAGGTVLDVGCGTGEVLHRLAELAPGLDLVGVDVDEGMLARATRKAGRLGHGAKPPTFLQGDAAALPIADESVDLVVSSYAAHHLADRHAALAEMLRVLKPGGKAIVWDIPAAHGAPSGRESSHHSLAGSLRMLRMVVSVSRLPPERHEIVKPAQV